MPADPAPPTDRRPLRVAMLAPISWRTPPRHYGPWELVTSLLTEALVTRGVDVTLFATADSVTKAKLAAVCPRGYSEDPSVDAKVWECLHIAHCFERARAGEFDLVHNQFDFLPLSYCGLFDTPVLTTIHGFSSTRIWPVFEKYDGRVRYVAISDADRHPRLCYEATIHHGIPVEEFTFHPEPGDYLLFYGRMHPDKGAAEAIAVARAAGRPLLMAGIVQDEGYFEREVAPYLDGKHVRYLGPVGPAERDRLLGGARALLHLINFDEPFGLSVVEAMACGTPVVARGRGSMPELIRDGETGFLVGATLEEAVAAVEKTTDLDRAAIRRHAERSFSVARMTERYLDVYRRIVEGGGR